MKAVEWAAKMVGEMVGKKVVMKAASSEYLMAVTSVPL